MAAIITLNLNLSKLDKSKFYEAKNGEKYYPVSVKIVDDYRYGKNVYAVTDYTKEEREAGREEQRIGNGKVRWTNGQIEVAVQEDAAPAAPAPAVQEQAADDFPF